MVLVGINPKQVWCLARYLLEADACDDSEETDDSSCGGAFGTYLLPPPHECLAAGYLSLRAM
jgi:hypothetical protein